MKNVGTTTQLEATPGNAVQRRPNSNSSISSTPRTSSPHHEETNTYFNPPSYETPAVPVPEEKESRDEEAQQFNRRHSSAMPETQSVPSRHYSQIPQSAPENFNPPLEEPACGLLPNRPAVWIVKGKSLKISSLTAAILLNDGILTSKDLTLLYNSYSPPIVDQGPTDPISGVLTATHRTVVGVLGGVADYPVAISRIATTDATTSKREAASFALDSGKGVSRIVGTGLKAPMEFTMGISQGFHNVPKLWGDSTVRAVEPVTGVSSGFKAAGKGFGLGLYDGVTGLFTQPVKGAKEGGVGGFVGGFFKGIGGVACKPAAGVAGLPAFAFQGFYEEYRKKRGMNIKTYTTAAQMQQGWEELGSCTVDERNEVLRGWYHVQNLEAQTGYKVQYQ